MTACYLLEEREGDFFCDCFEGIKGRMCKHTVGMHYRQNSGKLPVTDDVRSLPISSKRSPGRPKKPAGCQLVNEIWLVNETKLGNFHLSCAKIGVCQKPFKLGNF